MNGNEIRTLFHLMEDISASLARLAAIQQQRLQLELQMAINADSFNKILDILDTLLDKDASDVAAKDQAVADLADLKSRDAGLDDPALQAKMDSVVAKAAAANPPAPAPVPAPEPVPAPVAPNA